MLDESNNSDFKPFKSLQVDTKEGDAIIREELKRELLLLASVTNRGTWANQEERDIMSDIITQLEALNPTLDPVYQMTHDDHNDVPNLEHEWDLVVTNTQLFRASPFFLLLRSLLNEQSTANDVFDLYHQLTTSVSKIGRVREVFCKGELRSEIDLEVGFVKTTIITRATYESSTTVPLSPETMELYITSTNLKPSNDIPGLVLVPPFMDAVFPSSSSPLELPIGQLLKNIRGDVPRVELKTFYMDDGLRITRDVDDNFYVFSRV
jgi:hypothetical protein